MSLSFGPDWKGSGDIWGEGGQDPWRKKNKRRRRVTFLEHWCGGLYRLVSTAVTKHILRVHSEFIFPIRQKPKRALTHLLCVVLHRFFYIKKKSLPVLDVSASLCKTFTFICWSLSFTRVQDDCVTSQLVWKSVSGPVGDLNLCYVETWGFQRAYIEDGLYFEVGDVFCPAVKVSCICLWNLMSLQTCLKGIFNVYRYKKNNNQCLKWIGIYQWNGNQLWPCGGASGWHWFSIWCVITRHGSSDFWCL